MDEIKTTLIKGKKKVTLLRGAIQFLTLLTTQLLLINSENDLEKVPDGTARCFQNDHLSSIGAKQKRNEYISKIKY